MKLWKRGFEALMCGCKANFQHKINSERKKKLKNKEFQSCNDERELTLIS